VYLRKKVDAKEFHVDKLVVRHLAIRNREGVEVGSWLGRTGPYEGNSSELKLNGGAVGRWEQVTLSASSFGPKIELESIKHPIFSNDLRNLTLQVHPRTGPQLSMGLPSASPGHLILGTEILELVDDTETLCWRYIIPGLGRGTYPATAVALHKQLAAITPSTSQRDQDVIMNQIHELGLIEKELPTLYALCERFPEEKDFPYALFNLDEKLRYSEKALLVSLQRQPSHTTLSLLGTLIHRKRFEIEGVDTRALLETIAHREDLPPGVKELALRLHTHMLREYPREVPQEVDSIQDKPNPTVQP
jgi:hypothetical protein